MALRDEQADILGGPILQRPESGVLAMFSRYHIVFKSATLFGLGLLVWFACARGLEHLKKHRELRYRKAMRRKHGIPDSDCRPFAVAYAAAKRAHLEREAHDRKKTTDCVSDHNLPAVGQRTHTQTDARVLRKRVPETTVQLSDPRKRDVVYDNKRSEAHALNFADRYNPNPRHRAVVPEPSPVKWPSVHLTGKTEPDNEESRKRSFEDESVVGHETIKKSRIDADELKGGAEQADWYAQYSDSSSRRRPKGFLHRQPEGHLMYTNGQERPKRVDDTHDEDHEYHEAMEGIDEDKVTQLKAVARGKKRDRAEAGSTFGGDDEDDIRNGRASHLRKRRTISRGKIEISARGQKRDRSPESDGEGVDPETSGRPAHSGSKKKRGKKVTSDELNEISVDASRVSKDPLCGGRRVGDKWEADGVQYKVGEHGERWRLSLVKKARNKYHMPQDSQHPDRSAALEIYVEMWMTEEQYKEAEIRHELAWQEASRELSGPRTYDILDSPTKNGKSLLWDSVKSTPARYPFRQVILPGPSTRINPFEQSQSQPILNRRVASSSTVASPLLPGIVDSPMRPGFRGFSKWEKQDREAEAMARIRAKIEEQKKAQAPEIPTSVTAPELGTNPSSVPTITVTPASTVAAEGKADDSTSQNKLNISTFATLSGTNDSIKATTATPSGTTPVISPSSSSISATTPSTLVPNLVPTVPATTSSTGSLSPFSFAKLPQASLSMSTAPSSSTVPNIFGKASAPSASSPSTLGATTQLQPPSAESHSKPVPFSFTKPDISATPTVVGASTTKSEAAPTFNVASSSSSSPVTFSFTPAVTKEETSVPPPVLTSASTSEISKPMAPLFSFSGASSSSSTSTSTMTTSTAPPAPKFSFGQPSTPAPGLNQATGTATQPKPTFRFGQTLPGVTNGAFAASAADGSKKFSMPMSTFGTAASLNEPAKPSPFGVPSVFGASTFTSAPTTNLFGKSTAVDRSSSTAKPTLTSTSVSDSTISSTPTGLHTSSSAPTFAFGGTNSSSRAVGGSKSTSLFGGVAGGSNAGAIFGSNSMEGKPAFTFGDSVGGAKPTFALGAAESPKPASVFSGAAEGSKPTSLSGGVTESEPTTNPTAESLRPSSFFAAASDIPKPPNSTDPFKSTPASGSTTFTTSPFTFEKDDATNTATSTSTQTKPASSFTFGAPSSAIFGQPSAFATSGDPSHSVFGKPANATPSAFGFAGTGGTSSSNMFTFGKPTTQNQKQEQ